jgi:peptide/nickel transport system substrate-binding protein
MNIPFWRGLPAVLLLLVSACSAPTSPSLTTPTHNTPSPSAPAVPTVPGTPSGLPTETSKIGGTVNRVLTTDPDTLDPQQTSNPVASVILSWIYEPLLDQAPDGSYVGLLSESWTSSPDNKSIVFALRRNIKFSDGSPLNANAVKFTFERLQRVGTNSPIFDTFKNIASMETPDEFTFKLNLKEPYAPIFHDLATVYAGILAPSAVQAANDDISRQPVGTGPYTLKQWQKGQVIVLQRNADYNHPPQYYTNRGAPYIQELAYKIIADPAAQLAALEQGEVDVLGLQAKDVAKYGSDPRFKLYDRLATGLTYLGFNTAKPPYDNVKLRQALSHAVNKDEIVQQVFGGILARAVCCPIAPSIQGYDDRLKEYELKYDPDQSKQMLDDLGYTLGANGLRTTPSGKPFQPVLYTTTSIEYTQVSKLLQGQFKAVGIDLQVKQLEQAALIAATPKGEHDLLLFFYSWEEPDLFSLFLSCDRVNSSNRVLYCNQDLEKLIRAGRTELDLSQRLQIYFEAQKLTILEAPWQPLYMGVGKTAVSIRIQDLKQGPAGVLLWHDAYLSR